MLVAVLVASVVFAVLVNALEVAALLAHRARPVRGGHTPSVSVLKPLCGRDPGLEENLASFLEQDYPDFELLLGVRDARDPACAVAAALARAHPGRVRLAIQEGEPGLNPKVNQLCTLARYARGQVLVISDSNIRAPQGYLADLVAPLADPEVGMVTSPIAGQDQGSLGGQLDALHLHTFITPSVVATRLIAGRDLFIGKSMALRREDLEALGGFRAFGRLLAEDHALGQAMLRLGRRAELGRLPVVNVTAGSARQFYERYARWGIMQRWIGGAAYPAQVFTFPLLLTGALALASQGRPGVLAACLGFALAKAGLDALAIRALSGRWPRPATLALAPLREALAFAAFARGLFSNRVSWRGKPFYVTRGTRLLSPEARARLARRLAA